MADSENLRRRLNPLVLHLQKMELELKCPICLNLLSLPQLLPCDHIFCSFCINFQTSNGTCCPVCNAQFFHHDIRPSIHMETMVNIFKSMTTAFGANLRQHGLQVDISDVEMPLSDSPASASTNDDKSSEKQVHGSASGKFSILQSCTEFIGEKTSIGLAEIDEAAMLGIQKDTNNCRQEDLVDKEGPHSPPSFGDVKDSDHGSNNQGSDHKMRSIPKERLSREQLEFGANESEDKVRESKRQKLDNEQDKGGADLSVKCAFCHSFKTTEASGPMLHYHNGLPVTNKPTSPGILHVHQKCIEWAPQVYFTGETAMNVEAELARASRIKCSSCGLKGAALGCFVKSCRRSFHVPCAFDIHGCRWDCDKYLLLCPVHSSRKLPCDKSKTKKKAEDDIPSTQMREDFFRSSGSANSFTTPEVGELWATSAFVTSEWVLSGSVLSDEDKDLLHDFASVTGAVVAKAWKPKVTHVIASTNEHGACCRTFKVLMAILAGKWVLRIDWIKACMEAGRPVSEEPYEITHDVNGSFDGPRIGRIRANEKAPKLFAGLSFCWSGYYIPYYRSYLEELVLAAGGTLFQKEDTQFCQASDVKEGSTKLVVYCVEPPQGGNSDNDISEVIRERAEYAEALAARMGGWAVRHTWLLDAIASCNLQLSLRFKANTANEYSRLLISDMTPAKGSMACFNRASPALAEILNRLLSGERPTDIDHCLFEFGSVKYHVQAVESDSQFIYLSILTPAFSPEIPGPSGLPNYVLQEIKRVYSNVVEIVAPPKEGFLVTVRLDPSRIPTYGDDRRKAIREISSIQAVIMSSQLKDMLWNLDSKNENYGMCKPIKLVYHPRDPFFVIRMPEKITAIFPMRFKDSSDVAIATSFFQELMDVGYSTSFAKAPRCTWSPIPPAELRGESFQHLTTNGGFVSFDIFPHHVKGAKIDKTVWILLNFNVYVMQHVKGTRAYIQRTMRQRLEDLSKVLHKARTGCHEDNDELRGGLQKGRSCVKKVMSLPKSKILKRKCGAFRNQIQTIRSRIKIKGLYRFHRRWFRIPNLTNLRKYTKLE